MIQQQLSPADITLSLEQVNTLIRARRSVFPPKYSGEPVSDEEVMGLMENAHWAPTHGKTEPWFFKIFTGEGLKRFAEAHAELYKAHTPEADFKIDKYKKLANKPLMASHLIAICMKRGNNPKIPQIEEIEATACAVQNLHLTATAMGLAGYWSTGGMTYHESMREWLGLGREDLCLGFFFLGRPQTDEWPKGSRQTDFQEKIEWIRS